MDSPFEIRVYDRAFKRQGWVADPVAASFTPRFNAQGTGELRLSASDPVLEYLLAPGARVSCQYNGEHLMSGRALKPSGSFLPNGEIVVQISDDWRRMRNTLAWVRPNGEISPTDMVANTDNALGQSWLPGGGSDAGPDGTTSGQTGYYFWPDGSAVVGGVRVDSAEAAIKQLILANLGGRLNAPITVAANLNRGGDARAAGILPAVRFSTLEEAAAPILTWSGLGLRFAQALDGIRIDVDVWEPTVWPQVLDVASGIIQDGNWSQEEAALTRMVIGGPGEGVNRAFFSSVDAAREALTGEVIEAFKDATGANLGWPTSPALDDLLKVAKYFLLRPEVDALSKTLFSAYIQAASTKAYNESAATAGLALKLAETVSFRFGGPTGFHLGDTVKARSGGLNFSDKITECTIAVNAETGLTVTPVVGEKKDDPDRLLAQGIMALAASQRRLSTSR